MLVAPAHTFPLLDIRAVSMCDSNELVEPFEGASGAVVQFIDDGFDAGLVGGNGVRLGR